MLKGPVLNIGSPATELAPALLELVRNILLQDTEYTERIKQHYRIFRDKVDPPRKRHPLKKRKSNKRR